jgi:sirohydrochlorin cobaltochelatase
MTSTHTASALLLFAHGSSDPTWAAPFEAIRDAVAARSMTPVALAYLERMHPSLDEATAALAHDGVGDITLVPLFLAVGGHMRNDLPAMVREAEAAHSVRITVRKTIGESPEMRASIADWILGEPA